LTLDITAGQHVIRIGQEGYGTVERDVDVSPGELLRLSVSLTDIAAPSIALNGLPASVESGQSLVIQAKAADNEAVAAMSLLIDGKPVAEVRGPNLEYRWDTGLSATGPHTLVVQAFDLAGNMGEASGAVRVSAAPTVQPSPIVAPTASTSPTASPSVKVNETELTLSAYPYEPFLRERIDARNNFRVLWLDRPAYEATNPQPAPRVFRAVVLENRYLKLVFLPELGGRLYQCIFKPTGQNLFYQNAVLKPSYWGPLSRDANWWLAAGGMEWALPVQEHGYEWGVVWKYRTERRPDSATIALSSTGGTERLRAEIRVTLAADRASFVVEPRLTNPASQPVAVQFWINAALTLGSRSASPNTEFVYPTDQMIVHSTGDSALPGERQALPWPVYDGRDLSLYGNWRNWLGVFVPDVQRNYVGAYNHDTELGVVRLFPPEVARGVKLFAFGAGFPSRAEFADDGTEYFELWGGLNRTFWPEDDVLIGAGQSLGWSEVWMPFAAVGGLDAASTDVVFHSAVRDGLAVIGLATSREMRGTMVVSWNDQSIQRREVHISPEEPLVEQITLPEGSAFPGRLAVQWTDSNGKIILDQVREISGGR
jgi:hypothetical protein